MSLLEEGIQLSLDAIKELKRQTINDFDLVAGLQQTEHGLEWYVFKEKEGKKEIIYYSSLDDQETKLIGDFSDLAICLLNQKM